jgi:hypothetical protein
MNGCRKVVLPAVCAVSMLATSAFAVTKKKFDFIVGVNGDFKAAMAAAAKGASATNRFVIFFPEAEYNIGSLTGDANQKTTFTTSNVSFIGQSEDKTIVFNKSTTEGIGVTATLYFNNANDVYFQDLTVMNRANYGNVASYNETGRHVAVQEQGNKYVYKNVRLLSTQDTYYTKGKRTYWENGQIHGTTDFICGDGDVFFNGVLLYEMKKSAISAPSTTTTWGYVFKDCIIDGTVTEFTLGRSWNTGKAVFLNTTMKKLPSAAGWGDPMNSNPQLFAEYKSVNASGSLIDLSQRRKSYTSGTTVTLNPVLTDAEAAKYTVANVLGGSDNWQPQTLTKQIPAPVVTLTNGKLTWEDDVNALCWVVFKNGKYLANVTTNGFDLTSVASGDMLTVRAANAMGGLGAASTAVKAGAVTGIAPHTRRDVRSLKSNQAWVEFDGFFSQPASFTLSNAKGKSIYRATLAGHARHLKVDLSPLRLQPGLYWATATATGLPAKIVSLRIVE